MRPSSVNGTTALKVQCCLFAVGGGVGIAVLCCCKQNLMLLRFKLHFSFPVCPLSLLLFGLQKIIATLALTDVIILPVKGLP